MAKHQAIAVTGQAIIGLLADARPAEFDAARFELYQPGDFQSPMDEGVSLYLYRLAVNGSRRNLPPGVGADGRRSRPPIPLDLHYLLTAWAKTAARQQLLLGWALSTLHDAPVLNASFLNNYAPGHDAFRANEAVEVILDPLSLQDMSHLWGVARYAPPSLAYVVRVLAIESDDADDGARLSPTRAPGAGQPAES